MHSNGQEQPQGVGTPAPPVLEPCALVVFATFSLQQLPPIQAAHSQYKSNLENMKENLSMETFLFAT